MKKLINENLSAKSVVISLIGIFFISVGVAFNSNTALGNDPIGIFYDGIRAILGLELSQLGFISNFINIGLLLVLFFLNRKLINIGTFLYMIPYGFFVSIGTKLHPMIFTNDALTTRLLCGASGIALIYVGLGMFIASNIGVDAFSGFFLTIAEKTGWSIQRSKITMDICLTIIGFALGGTFGLITVVCAATCGPAVQFLTAFFKKFLYDTNPIAAVEELVEETQSKVEFD